VAAATPLKHAGTKISSLSQHHLQWVPSCRLLRWRNIVAWARQLPKYLGAIETGMRFARAIKQVPNLRLLVAYNKSRSKSALPILLRGQTAPRPSDDIRE
jgi:hypothetical protein